MTLCFLFANAVFALASLPPDTLKPRQAILDQNVALAPYAPREQPIVLYSSGNFRFRESPGGEVKKIIPKGESFLVVAKTADWYQVSYKGKIGYIHKDGITHPLAKALQQTKGFEALSPQQAAEYAACVSAVSESPLDPSFQQFLQTLHEKLPKDKNISEKRIGLGEEKILHRNTIQRLAKNARQAAAKYRFYAPHVCKRRGRKYPCGGSANPHHSKGFCKAGVMETLNRTFGLKLPMGPAISAIPHLTATMVKVEVNDCAKAPPGSICVYESSNHDFGHIEIKASANEYCSDYCAARPVRRAHTLVGVFYPGN